MCSETSPPRLSFSRDFSVSEVKQDVSRKDTLLLESNSDFEFSTSSSIGFESSSADELFSNGVILPFQIQERITTQKHRRYGERETPYMKPPRPCPPSVEKIREHTQVNSDYEKKTQSKSFWGFSRSKSLNCDSKKNLIFSLPLLSRSNSTGSVPNLKRTSSSRRPSAAKSSSSSSSSTLSLYPVQKSASGKSYGGSYGNGLRVSPVLNVPTPYLSKGSASLFGLGSFLRVGRIKKSKN